MMVGSAVEDTTRSGWKSGVEDLGLIACWGRYRARVKGVCA